MLFECHIPAKSDERNVVLEVGGAIGRVYFLSLHRVLLVGQLLRSGTHVPLPEADPKVGVRGAEITNIAFYTSVCNDWWVGTEKCV